MSVYEDDDRRSYRTPRRHHPLRILLIVLLVLVALAVVADRVGVVIADNVAAGRIQQNENLSTKPDVSIKGFPFLTQVADMRFDHVTASASDVESNGLTITDVRVDMRGVKPTSDFHSAHVDTLHGTGFIDYADLSRYAASHLGQHVSIGPGPDGRLAVKGSFLGISATLDAKLTVLSNNRVQVIGSNLASPIPGLGSIDLGRLLDFTMQLGDLPFGLDVTGASTTAQGVTITANSTNTTLSSS